MSHKIHTAWGISEGYGPEDSTFPLQGILQDNGAGSCLWLVISVTIFNMMREERLGMFLTTPVTKEPIHIVGFAIVNDADLFITSEKENPTRNHTLKLD